MRDAVRVERALSEAERAAKERGAWASGGLPELEGSELVFAWDADGPEERGMQPVAIRRGEQVIWRGSIAYEGAQRFVEMAAILAHRYGARAKDLVPAGATLMFLLGDASFNDRLIEAARGRLRAGWVIGGEPARREQSE
jgi:hypothetical protein